MRKFRLLIGMFVVFAFIFSSYAMVIAVENTPSTPAVKPSVCPKDLNCKCPQNKCTCPKSNINASPGCKGSSCKAPSACPSCKPGTGCTGSSCKAPSACPSCKAPSVKPTPNTQTPIKTK